MLVASCTVKQTAEALRICRGIDGYTHCYYGRANPAVKQSRGTTVPWTILDRERLGGMDKLTHLPREWRDKHTDMRASRATSRKAEKRAV